MIAPLRPFASAVMRPPGVTRWARRRLRARRHPRPAADDAGPDRPGRVTIRLLLSDTGDLRDLQLIRSGGDPIIDQNVVFAARQSSFPLPPVGATSSDRTFLVTYVYQ